MNNIIVNKINNIITKDYDMQDVGLDIFLKPWKNEINKELIFSVINSEKIIKFLKRKEKSTWMFCLAPSSFLGIIGILMKTGNIYEHDIVEAALNKFIELVDLVKKKYKEVGEDQYYIPYSEDDYNEPDITIADFFYTVNKIESERKFIENFIDEHINYFLSLYTERYISNIPNNTPLFINPYIEMGFTFSVDFLKKNKKYLRIDALMENKQYKIEAQEVIFRDILPEFMKTIAMYKTNGLATNYNKHYSEEELTTILLKYNLGE